MNIGAVKYGPCRSPAAPEVSQRHDLAIDRPRPICNGSHLAHDQVLVDIRAYGRRVAAELRDGLVPNVIVQRGWYGTACWGELLGQGGWEGFLTKQIPRPPAHRGQVALAVVDGGRDRQARQEKRPHRKSLHVQRKK